MNSTPAAPVPKTDDLPDGSNFFGSLWTTMSREEVATLFATAGWQARKAGWQEFEVECPWAELVIEAEAPILLHGPVADVEVNAVRVLAVLAQAGIAYSAEAYGPDDKLIAEWQHGLPHGSTRR